MIKLNKTLEELNLDLGYGDDPYTEKIETSDNKIVSYIPNEFDEDGELIQGTGYYVEAIMSNLKKILNEIIDELSAGNLEEDSEGFCTIEIENKYNLSENEINLIEDEIKLLVENNEIENDLFLCPFTLSKKGNKIRIFVGE